MKNKKFIAFAFSFLCVISSYSQDSLIEFTPENFVALVRENHPIAKQYKLLTEKGEKTVLREKGNLDPYIFSNVDQKYFDNKQYYNLISSGLKVPTWFGLDFKLGLDQSSGSYINAENKLPNSGLVYAGVSMPILQGFWINERRTIIKQANVFAKSTEAERVNLINDLIYEAIASYWEWYNAYNKLAVFESAVQIAQQRFNAVKSSYLLGDRPAIDTLESFIQLQNRIFGRNQAQIEKTNASLQLSNFLWNEKEEPLELQQNMSPVSPQKFIQKSFALPDSLNKSSKDLAMRHPAISMYDYKYEIANLDKRWKQEKLKPKLNLNYNLLNEPIGSEWIGTFSANNYKWGVDFSFPVFLRRERGDLQLANLKMMEIDFSREQKILEISNKIEQYKNELNITQQQNTLFTQLVQNYEGLWKAERRNFDAGESSLFLVNAREMAYIDSKLKYIELQAKLNKCAVALVWSTGQLK